MSSKPDQPAIDMTVFQTPYPRANLLRFSKVLFLIGLSVAFILIVFQPFGTTSFTHTHKMAILAGYGMVIFFSGVLFFIVSEQIITDKLKNKWSVGHEVLFLFLTLLICQSSCFLYYIWLFGKSVTLMTFIYFLMIASSVSVLPVGFYLFVIYMKYRDVRHALSLPDDGESFVSHNHKKEIYSAKLDNPQQISISGSGKNERYEFPSDHIRLIKAEDNYVILYTSENGTLRKWMIRVTMNELENQLPASFMRIHRSYIIHTHFILDVTGNVSQTRVRLESIPDDIPVARSKVPQVRELRS